MYVIQTNPSKSDDEQNNFDTKESLKFRDKSEKNETHDPLEWHAVDYYSKKINIKAKKSEWKKFSSQLVSGELVMASSNPVIYLLVFVLWCDGGLFFLSLFTMFTSLVHWRRRWTMWIFGERPRSIETERVFTSIVEYLRIPPNPVRSSYE